MTCCSEFTIIPDGKVVNPGGFIPHTFAPAATARLANLGRALLSVASASVCVVLPLCDNIYVL